MHLRARVTRCLTVVVGAVTVVATSVVLAPGASAAAKPPRLVADPAAEVNTFIGTTGNADQPWGGQGDTYPGAQAPFGMLDWGPDTPSRPSGGGYDYKDSTITGFSLTHVNGSGCNGLAGDVPFLPISGDLPAASALLSAAAPFDHSTESSAPGRYAVTAGEVRTQLATTQRAGIATFTYPGGTAARLLLKTGGGSALGDTAASVQVVGDRQVEGTVTPGKFCGFTPTYDLHFAITFDQPFTSVGTWTGNTATDGSRSASGPNSGAYLSFAPGRSGKVRAKVGISYVDAGGASLNRDREIPGWNQAAVENRTYNDWNGYLRRVEIAGGSSAEQHVFYTSLYRAFEGPNVFDDVGGRYLGFDDKVHVEPKGRHFYTTFSGWDTYRTEQPLLAWLAPKEASDMMQSMVDAGEQSPTHSLPHWTVANHDGFVMPGDPSAALIASSYALGARNFDASEALDLLIAQSAREHTYTQRSDASTVLEDATADFASAQLATALGRDADAKMLMAKAQSWVSRLDPATGFIRPTTADGFFAKSFDPTGSDGMVEGTALQYRFAEPFALSAMINAVGGPAATVRDLDTFFTNVNGGLDTHYAWMGDEPGEAIPYAYLNAGAPAHTQRVISRIRRQLYTNTPNGLIGGNDDLGAMSSWYVFAALGVFPQTPGTGTLVLNNPLLPYAVVHRPGGDLTISAPATTASGSYIQQLKVDGHNHNQSYLPQRTVLHGATLTYTMGATPSKSWGVRPQDRPRSFTDQMPSVAAGLTPAADSTSVAPGSTAQYTLTVADLIGQRQDATWTLNAPGLAVSPASGTLHLTPHSRAAALITIAGRAAEGVDSATLTVTGRNGPPITRALSIKVANNGGLLSSFDTVATSPDSDPQLGNFGGGGSSYSRDALAAAGLTPGTPVTADGVSLTWPNVPAGSPDSVHVNAQTITLNARAGASTLGVLGSGLYACNGTSGTATINYTDGTSATAQLSLGDWTRCGGGAAILPGNTIVAQTSYRNTTTTTGDPVKTYLFSDSIPVDPGKQVASVTLPSTVSTGQMYVLAIGTN